MRHSTGCPKKIVPFSKIQSVQLAPLSTHWTPRGKKIKKRFNLFRTPCNNHSHISETFCKQLDVKGGFILQSLFGSAHRNFIANLRMVWVQNAVTTRLQNANDVTVGATLWGYLGQSSKKYGYLLKV